MSKILYLCSLESDYLQDTIYSGLVDILGVERIIDWPWNRHFHWPRKKYPRNLGFRSFNFRHLTTKITGIPWTEISCVMVAATKPDCFESFLQIQNQIPNSVPVVFLDGGDLPELGGDLFRLKQPELWHQAQSSRSFDFIFKREMLEQKTYPKNTAPLPFAIPYRLMPALQKPQDFRYDVSFWAVESDPIRTQALGLLENQFDCRLNGTTRNQVFKKYKRKGLFYLEELARCKVVLNFRGVGWDTLRYWEVFGLERFMISQKPQIQIPDNFENGKEIIFCQENLADLIDLCRYYLDHPNEREAIAQAGARKAQEKHSDRARAQYALQILKTELKVNLF